MTFEARVGGGDGATAGVVRLDGAGADASAATSGAAAGVTGCGGVRATVVGAGGGGAAAATGGTGAGVAGCGGVGALVGAGCGGAAAATRGAGVGAGAPGCGGVGATVVGAGGGGAAAGAGGVASVIWVNPFPMAPQCGQRNSIPSTAPRQVSTLQRYLAIARTFTSPRHWLWYKPDCRRGARPSPGPRRPRRRVRWRCGGCCRSDRRDARVGSNWAARPARQAD